MKVYIVSDRPRSVDFLNIHSVWGNNKDAVKCQQRLQKKGAYQVTVECRKVRAPNERPQLNRERAR